MELKVTDMRGAPGILLPEELLEKLRLRVGDALLATEMATGVEFSSLELKILRQLEVAEGFMRESRNLLHELAR